MNGIIVLDKPEGFTSHDAVAKLRRARGERRGGHGGTWDPMATGVLPIFVGRATRAVEFFESAEKEYVAGLRLGITTDTQDTTGTTLCERDVSVTREELLTVLASLVGEREQTPPMYSAVKVGGERLYKLARRGVEVARPARRIRVSAAELLGGAGREWRIRLVVSKGTYVRTLCDEIGAALGCGAAMSALRRTRAGAFTIESALTLAEAEERAGDGEFGFLLPVEAVFHGRPPVTVGAAAEKRLRDGSDADFAGGERGEVLVYSESGEFLALCDAVGGKLRTIKNFFNP
jgi:tRNA pseudouridine55 synthase